MTLVPWRIQGIHPPNITFRGFFHEHGSRFIEGSLNSLGFELHSTFVGTSEERMDLLVNPGLQVVEVTGVFGPYAKFVAQEIGEQDTNTISMNEGGYQLE